MWTKTSIENNIAYCGRIGLANFYVKKIDKEWLFSKEKSEILNKQPDFSTISHVPPSLKWTSILGDKKNSLIISPAFPDRPIIVKPNATFKLLPGKTISISIQVPMWIQFYTGIRKKENILHEIATEELSSTWFGEVDNGMLAYALHTDFSTEQQNNSIAHTIKCPIRITNDSTAILDVQKLLIHCEYLSVFELNNALYSNEVKIKFKGENEISDVHFGSHTLPSGSTSNMLATPRSTKANNVLTKSFYYIKSLTNY